LWGVNDKIPHICVVYVEVLVGVGFYWKFNVSQLFQERKRIVKKSLKSRLSRRKIVNRMVSPEAQPLPRPASVSGTRSPEPLSAVYLRWRGIRFTN